MFCPECGVNYDEDAAFCEKCGVKLQMQETKSGNQDISACPICGNVIEEGDIYCTSCGRVLDANTVNGGIENNLETSTAGYINYTAIPAVENSETYNANNVNTKSIVKDTGKIKIIAAIAGVVVVLAVITGILSQYLSSSRPQASEVVSPTPTITVTAEDEFIRETEQLPENDIETEQLPENDIESEQLPENDIETEHSGTETLVESTPSPSNDPAPLYMQVGNIIQFGGYDWRVLDVQEEKVLIITEDIIEERLYHYEFADITWEESGLREYLNGRFINGFNESDKNRIAITSVTTNDNPWYGTYGGMDTEDYIFLLSLDEIVYYFGDSGQLANSRPSDGHVINDIYNRERVAHKANGSNGWWWLRSPGSSGNPAAYVHSDGRINVSGGPSGNVHVDFSGGVRPALWLKTN